MQPNSETTDRYAVPCPQSRLVLALALGAFAGWLFRGSIHHRPEQLMIWFSVACACVLPLRIKETSRLRVIAFAPLFSALAGWLWCHYFPYPLGNNEILNMYFAFSACVFMAGIGGSGLPPSRFWEGILRLPAMVVVAPLLLFASRPSRYIRRPIDALFAMLPHLFSAAITLYPFLEEFRILPHNKVISDFTFNLVVWTWAACSLIFVLTVWPLEPHLPRVACLDDPSNDPIKACILISTPIVFACVIILSIGFREFKSVLLIPATIAAGVAYYSMLVQRSELPFIPNLSPLPKGRGMGPVATVVFFLFAFGIVSIFLAFLFRFKGPRFDGRWLIAVAVLTGLVLPYLSTARWASDRSTERGYYTFAVSSFIIRVCLLFLFLPLMTATRDLFSSWGAGAFLKFGIELYLIFLIVFWEKSWLVLMPFGFRLLHVLRAQGYEWATLNDARRMLIHLRSRAYHVPPAHEYELIPGSTHDSQCLITFMKALTAHKQGPPPEPDFNYWEKQP